MIRNEPALLYPSKVRSLIYSAVLRFLIELLSFHRFCSQKASFYPPPREGDQPFYISGGRMFIRGLLTLARLIEELSVIVFYPSTRSRDVGRLLHVHQTVSSRFALRS